VAKGCWFFAWHPATSHSNFWITWHLPSCLLLLCKTAVSPQPNARLHIDVCCKVKFSCNGHGWIPPAAANSLCYSTRIFNQANPKPIRIGLPTKFPQGHHRKAILQDRVRKGPQAPLGYLVQIAQDPALVSLGWCLHEIDFEMGVAAGLDLSGFCFRSL